MHTFTATDADVGIAGKVRFLSLTDHKSWLFTVSEASGELRLSHLLDRENVSSYTMAVRAIDSAPSPFELFRDHSMTVSVLDVNDNVPKFASSVVNITVPETVTSGQVAFSVIASDPDYGDNGRVGYFIVWTNDTGKFLLSTSSGEFLVTGKNSISCTASFCNFFCFLPVRQKAN